MRYEEHKNSCKYEQPNGFMNQISFLFQILLEYGVQLFFLARNGKYIFTFQPSKTDEKWTQNSSRMWADPRNFSSINLKFEHGIRHTGISCRNFFHSTIYHPGGFLGCPEKRTRSRNYNLFVWSAVFQPKLNDIKKTNKNYQNPVKSYCF